MKEDNHDLIIDHINTIIKLILTVVIFYIAYKIFAGTYHLLDKLIDKI